MNLLIPFSTSNIDLKKTITSRGNGSMPVDTYVQTMDIGKGFRRQFVNKYRTGLVMFIVYFANLVVFTVADFACFTQTKKVRIVLLPLRTSTLATVTFILRGNISNCRMLFICEGLSEAKQK